MLCAIGDAAYSVFDVFSENITYSFYYSTPCRPNECRSHFTRYYTKCNGRVFLPQGTYSLTITYLERIGSMVFTPVNKGKGIEISLLWKSILCLYFLVVPINIGSQFKKE